MAPLPRTPWIWYRPNDLSSSMPRSPIAPVFTDTTRRNWWPRAESNHRHTDFQSAALPTELLGRTDAAESSAALRKGADYKGKIRSHKRKRRQYQRLKGQAAVQGGRHDQ